MYILEYNEQNKIISELTAVESLDGGWSRKFVDSVTGQTWLLFYLNSSGHDPGTRVLREDPRPEKLSDWLKQCFSSARNDDVRCLAWELSNDVELWSNILDWLDTNKQKISTPKLQLFIENLGVLHMRNRRPIIGKSAQEIEEDSQVFQKLAKRAEYLLKAA